jgi:hypothetical protein
MTIGQRLISFVPWYGWALSLSLTSLAGYTAWRLWRFVVSTPTWLPTLQLGEPIEISRSSDGSMTSSGN